MLRQVPHAIVVGPVLSQSFAHVKQAMRNTDSDLYKLIAGLGKQASENDQNSEEEVAAKRNDLVDLSEEEDSQDPECEERRSEIDDAQAGIPLANRRESVATMRRASML